MNDRYLDEAWAVTLSGKRAPILTHTCRSFLERFCGLMLKREVPEACGLYFPNCRSIHTCMMRVPIDVVWVVRTSPACSRSCSLDIALKPWRFFAAPRGATGCVEFRAGSFDPDDPAGQDRPPGTKEIGYTVRNAAAARRRSPARAAACALLAVAVGLSALAARPPPWRPTAPPTSRCRWLPTTATSPGRRRPDY